MKTLCPKSGKGGKIHPSPVEDPIGSAFRLLPAAILVLVAGLGPEDREVLAYFVALPVDLAKGAAPLLDHPPTHGCGCFECYTSFWARWSCSPERDRILDALQAFEEHLAAAESSVATPSSSRRRGRRSRLPNTTPPPPPPPIPLRRPKSPVPEVAEGVQVPASPLPPSFLPPPPPLSQAPEEEEGKVVPEPAAAAEPEECREVAAEASEEERKRGWADVMGGVLGLRLWGIWSPAVESAT